MAADPLADYTPLCTVRPLANERCVTGENPFWNPKDGSVWWTDIPTGRLFRFETQTGTHACVYRGEPVGGFTLQTDGSWLLFRVTDLARLAPNGTVTSVLSFSDVRAKRFNDVIADPEGRVYAGTIGADKESGGLYRIDTNRTITCLWTGTGVANGMAFSPDQTRFYWTDSTARRLYRFQYDRATGALSDRTLFYEAAPDEGTPDGLVVDTEGFVWSARNRGSRVLRHAPNDGRIVGEIRFPVPKVTSLCFGGPTLDRFYVTTGGGDGGESRESDANTPADGTLYEVAGDLPARGLPEFLSHIPW